MKTSIDPGQRDDPHVRYRREVALLQVLPRNVTRLRNLHEISKAIDRPAELIMSFGAWYFKSRKGQCEWAGKFAQEQVESMIDSFVTHFVLCRSCSCPETVLAKAKSQCGVKLRCKACGSKTYPKHPFALKIHQALKR